MAQKRVLFFLPAGVSFFGLLFVLLALSLPASAQPFMGPPFGPPDAGRGTSSGSPAPSAPKSDLLPPPSILPPGVTLPAKAAESLPPGFPKGKDEIMEMLKGKKPGEAQEPSKKHEEAPGKETQVPKEKSEIESIFSGKIPTTVSTDLLQFGYDLFRSTVSTFAPVTDVPVGPDYVIGPGDRFSIFLWGKFDTSYHVEVNRDGVISLPKLGALKVWGLTFSQLKEFLSKEFSKYYKDFQLNLTMDGLRTIQVYVVGEAVTPGSYTLSSLSTVYNALFAAGGPSKRGSLRNIQLLRKGKKTQTLDLYEFLLKGDQGQDERLQSGDTVFIPVIGPTVGMAGNFKRPAIYEMKGPMTLQEMIELAGGISVVGSLNRVQIERVAAHEKRIIADFDLSTMSRDQRPIPELSVKIQDMDLVKVFPIFPQMQKVVYLEGHVKRPGGYEWKEGMKISDLIPSAASLLPEAYLKYAQIIRTLPPDFRRNTFSVNLEKLLLQRDPESDVPLLEQDHLVIFALKDMRELPNVSVLGEVNRPGKYPLLGNMRVRDLVHEAGNLKRSAYLQEAEITRLSKTEKGVTSRVININLQDALRESPEHNFLLEEDDNLIVRQIPKWYVDKTMTIGGEVKYPGVYTFQKGERLSSVLERAGGFTTWAYLPAAVFTRDSVRKIQEKRIQEFIQQQEQEIVKEAARTTEGALSKDEAEQRQKALEQRKQLIGRLKTVTATGRVVIKLLPLDQFKGSEQDLELEEGDTLQIPMVPSTVMVMGRVFNPNANMYTNEKTLEYYLNKVGGPAENADEKRIYLVRADGSVISRVQSGWGFMSTAVGPGDTILGPEKYERIYWTRELRDWTQILFQIALAAGVVVALF